MAKRNFYQIAVLFILYFSSIAVCFALSKQSEDGFHKLNGKIVIMAIDLPFSEGLIGLQSETAEIYYRNIEIKEFDKFIPMETFLK